MYAALSHCWGGIALTVITTLGTLPRRKQRIEYSELPLLFRDAIQITSKLGLRYIWIDCLCIIQDSHDDWEAEAARMCGIYEGAHLTLAAGSSSSSKEPILQARTVSHIPLRLPGYAEEIIARKSTEDLKPEWNGGPLSTRGWTWQEYMLSRRVVMFTEKEVKWHCKTLTQCECSPQAAGPDLHSNLYETHRDAYYTWHTYLEAFSRRKLTFTSDKLYAIAGAASKIHTAVGSDYLAGLWKNNLIVDLLWHRDRSIGIPIAKLHSNNPDFNPPSWSWASIDAALEC
ncbi:HET-domain-containing protein [Aulographum hederae CBS 113979]|uniref:HET-domain-containing protein n=1 Tax=Aulographum hederae CBS 113979 TaxID=1176131 RepID=A0A6G1H5X0_9PEZI|nr:HET-domain-containing protein [Aulographum hederae CBS 113979]